MKKKRHVLILEVECLDAQSPKAARDRVLRWIETNGHTSPGHGFTFWKMDINDFINSDEADD